MNSKQIEKTVMKKDNIYFDDDGECHVCDKLAIDRYYNNHLKSKTLINSFRKRQQFNITNNSTSFSTTSSALDFEKVVFLLTKVMKSHPVILKFLIFILLYINLLDQKLSSLSFSYNSSDLHPINNKLSI